jgi:hypothetical protein
MLKMHFEDNEDTIKINNFLLPFSYSFNHGMNQIKLELLYNHSVIANPLRKYLPPASAN